MAADAGPGETGSPRWFSRGVAGTGFSSFLADLGHEVPTALLPSLVTVTLHAPASALGLIEGISDCWGAGTIRPELNAKASRRRPRRLELPLVVCGDRRCS